MPRRPDRDKAEWRPNPASDEAFTRIIDIAHRCAATLAGEKPVENPVKDASPAALHLAMAMAYFLCRIDPKDMVALASGPGSFADFDYKPFPPVSRRKPVPSTLSHH